MEARLLLYVSNKNELNGKIEVGFQKQNIGRF
jgi:hypothetical protein